MYLFLSHKDSENLYPDNSPADFTVELPRSLSGNFISLQNIYFKRKEVESEEYFYILCDIVESSILGGQERKVLGSFFESGSIVCPQDLPLTSNLIRRLHIRIVNTQFKQTQNLVATYLKIKVH